MTDNNDSIYTPNLSLTPTIAASLEEIERKAWLVDRLLLMPKHEVWIRREVSTRRVAGTTAIEGVGLPEDRVAELAREGHVANPDAAERANLNALRAYEFVDYLSDQGDVPIDELVVRELNRQLMHGEPDVLTPGSYRKGQNRINNFTPPNQGNVPGLMRAFGLWLREEQRDLHPILKAGLAHLHIVAIHPFWDGNGRTARALSTLIVQRSSYHFRKLLSIEQTLAADRDSYIAAIERTVGPAFTTKYDATAWLEFFVRGMLVAANWLEGTLTDWQRFMETTRKEIADAGLKERQADALAYAARVGKITRKDYVEVAQVRPLTASRDLADLVRQGWLVPKGRTKDRVYEVRLPSQGPEPDARQQRLAL